MKQDFNLLRNCPLFLAIDENRFPYLLKCLGAKTANYHKNQSVFVEGDPAGEIGIVLSGKIQIVKEDFDGNRNIVASVEPPHIFGEAFACAGVRELPVGAVAACDSSVIWISCERLQSLCDKTCTEHNQLIHNLLFVVASNNLWLRQKIELISKRTTKEKLMAYLFSESKRQKSNEFLIPYNRQELADYLGVERSAMSAELGKLKREGKILFHKNRFRLQNHEG